MQDRVPLYPGRVKLSPVAGQNNTFDMVRADEPTQPGTPLNKETLLKDVTASILGLPNTAVPDDAFLALIIGVGTYGYRVKIKLEDGTPVEGATVSGIEPLTGSTLVSGADGIVLGKSTKASVTIGCTIPYIDQKTPDNQSIMSTGTITDVTMTLTKNTDVITVTTSKVAKISHMPKTVDITAVGGGGGGGAYYVARQWGGGGGGGGNSKHALNVDLISRFLEIAVGSGGYGGSETTDLSTYFAGKNGGTTSVKFQGASKEILSASGGGGGSSIGWRQGGTSINGGNGGSGCTSYSNNNGSDGKSSKEHIFGDDSLGLAGGGGGGGGEGTSFFYNGGMPFGGRGDGANVAASSGKSPGGGGGSFSRTPAHGGSGGVYLRFHF